MPKLVVSLFSTCHCKNYRQDMNKTSPSRQKKLKHCLSPGLPYLHFNTMSDSLQLENVTFGAHEKRFRRDVHGSIFPLNQSITKEEKQSADTVWLSSWISGSFPPPPTLPSVDSLSDSEKNPSYIQAGFLLNRLELSSPPTTLRNSYQLFTNFQE